MAGYHKGKAIGHRWGQKSNRHGGSNAAGVKGLRGWVQWTSIHFVYFLYNLRKRHFFIRANSVAEIFAFMNVGYEKPESMFYQ